MKVSHRFVENIPMTLEQGVVYVSIRYRTAMHLCMCGCGSKVVTPIRPERWQLTYDGQAISLWPSIGSWDLPCQSHYWIKGDAMIWSGKMTDKEINLVKRDQSRRVADYYQEKSKRKIGWIRRIKRRNNN